jgi:hypothetical protein
MADKTNHNFYVFIPVIAPSIVDRLLPAMVKQGYTVAALDPEGNPQRTLDRNMVSLITLNVAKALTEANTNKAMTIVFENIRSILKDISGKYYTLIVTSPCACQWSLGNMNLPTPPPIPAGAYRTTSKLN